MFQRGVATESPRLSLSRDRLYSQDLSDLEYVAALLDDPGRP